MLQSRETVWWFLLKCQIQGLFPLRDPQVNLQHFVFQPAKDWPGLWALAPHSLFFVCLDWLIQVTTCYFLSKYCGWIFFFPLMAQISYLPAVSLHESFVLAENPWWQSWADGRGPDYNLGCPGRALSVLMRTQWQWVTVLLGHWCPETTAVAAAAI